MSDRVDDKASVPSEKIFLGALNASGSIGPAPSADALRRNLSRSVSLESRKAAKDMITRQRPATPVRKTFVRMLTESTTPPMAQVYQGGRSGTVALKVYLALLWRCARHPYNTTLPARGLATLLDLPEPETQGARRVTDALRQLAAANLITITPQAGRPHLVTLLDESGDGSEYTLPSTAYTRAPAGPRGDAQRERNRYFLVPNQLWLDGDIQELKGPGLVLLLILLAEQGGEGKPIWFATEEFPKRYDISAKTRADGRRQLEALYLLHVDREPVSPTQSTFDIRRRRNVYHLQGPTLAANFKDPLRQITASTPHPPRRRRISPSPQPKMKTNPHPLSTPPVPPGSH